MISKNYKDAAKILSAIKDRQHKLLVCEALVCLFLMDDPKFNENDFRKACE